MFASAPMKLEAIQQIIADIPCIPFFMNVDEPDPNPSVIQLVTQIFTHWQPSSVLKVTHVTDGITNKRTLAFDDIYVMLAPGSCAC